MSNYSKIVDYAAKDALNTGDPLKLIKGTEIGAEYDAIATAIATKANTASPAFTGVSGFAVGAVGAPSIYITGYATTGWYNIGANNLGFAVSGAKVLDIASTGLSVTGATTSSGGFVGSSTTSVAVNGTGSSLMLGYIGSAITSTTDAFVSWMPETHALNPVAVNGSLLVAARNSAGAEVVLVAENAVRARVSSTGLAVTGDVSVSTKTPASAAAAGVAGTITWDANYLYCCIATNTWKRVAIATW